MGSTYSSISFSKLPVKTNNFANEVLLVALRQTNSILWGFFIKDIEKQEIFN